MIYKLILQNDIDGLTQRIWTFKPPVDLGRDASSGVCIDHHSISRMHCQFTLNGDGALVVKDHNSTNGIYVDHERVQQKVLMPHQIVQIGALRLQVEFSTEDEHAATSSAAPRPKPQSSIEVTQPLQTFRQPEPALKKSWWRKLLG